jgi:ATP-dependent HslUV protease subunit HslV
MRHAPRIIGTTVLSVRRGRNAVVGADGQVTLDRSVVKAGAHKVRRLANGSVLAGFAGGAADAFALLTRFQDKLSEHGGRLERAAVELVRDWRTDRALRRLEAMLIVADAERTLLLSGTGDLIEPDDGVVAIGSGGIAAMAAARALMRHTDLAPRALVEQSLLVAASIDVFTNDHLIVEEV